MFEVAVLILVTIYVDYHLTKHNWGVWCNGVGCIDDVVAGRAQLPMQHRILVPFIVAWLSFGGRVSRAAAYVWVRHVSIVAMYVASWWFFVASGVDPVAGCVVLAIFVVYASLYDYTDFFVEIALFALFLYAVLTGGNWLFALPLIACASFLNRETAIVFVPIAYFVSGVDALVSTVAGIIPAFAYVRLKYDSAERYCKFNLLRKNIRGIGAMFSPHLVLYNEHANFFVLVIALAVVYVGTAAQAGLSALEVVMAVFFVLMLIPSMWREIRVFGPVVLVAIPMYLRLS
jgi:hypothetical protein